MSRLVGPDESCRTVFLTSGTNAGKAAAQGMSVPIYIDQALTTLADIRSTTGDVVAESTLTVNAYSQIPLFQFPDGVDTVYTSVNGGPPVALYARTDDRLDGLAVRVTALEPGGDDEAATAADLAAHAADTTNVHGIADTAVLETVSGAQAKATTAQNAAVSAAATDATAKAASAQAAAISAAATDATTKAAAAQAAAVAAAATDATTKANAAQAAATTAAATDATTKANAAQAAAVTAAATDATTKADAAAAASLPRAGGTVTGPIVLPGGWRLPLVQPSWRRPRWRDVSGFRENFQTGHSWSTNGSGVASSNDNDTSAFCRGTQSAALTTTGTAATANLRRFANAGLASLDLADKMFRVVLRVDSGAARINNLSFFLGTSSLANNYKWIFNPTTASSLYITEGQWLTAAFGWHDINSAAGTFTFPSGVPNTLTGFTDMQIQVVDNGTGPVTLRVQAIEIIDAGSTTFPTGVISITFDDSWASQWDLARPAMDAHGFRGTQYTIADLIGTSGRLTLDQLKRLQDQSGWEIGGHAYTSVAHTARLPTMTAADVDVELGQLKTWLLQSGLDGDSFAYPGGQFEQTTDGVWVEDIAARYFSSARSILGVPLKAIESFPPPMPHRMRAVSSISSLNAANGMNQPTGMLASGGILDKIAGNGGYLPMCFHQITAGAPTVTSEISAADFTALMQGIADRGIAVVPVSDVVRHYG